MKVLLYVDTGVAPCAATVVPTPEGDPDEDASGRHKNLVLTYLPENAGGKPLQNLWGTDAAAFENVAVTNASADRCASLRPSGMSGPVRAGQERDAGFWAHAQHGEEAGGG